MSQEQRRRIVSTGDNILASAMGNAFERAIRQMREEVPQGFSFVAATPYNPETTAAVANFELVAARMDARDKLTAQIAALQIAPELKAELMGRLSEIDGARNMADIHRIAAGISHQIKDASQYTTSQVSLNDQEAKEQKLLAQWNAYKDSSKAARDDFRNNGYVDTPENEEKLAKLWAKMETLEPGSSEWKKTGDKITRMDAAYFQRVKEEAIKRGDWETVKKAEDALKNTRETQEAVKELNVTKQEMHTKGKEEKKLTKVTASFDEDEEPTITQEVPDKQTGAIAKNTPLREEVELGNLSPTIVSKNIPSGSRGLG